MSNIQLKIAILSCDTPVESVLKRYGDYFVIYKDILSRAFNELNQCQEAFDNVSVTFTEHDMVKMEAFPDPSSVDAVIMTGSKHDAWADDPWILSLTNHIHEAVTTHNLPVIGFCFGHQILARALGAKVGRGNGWEISVGEVNLNETGKALFGKETISIQQMHRDIVFEVPEGCVNIGTSPICEVQGLYSPNKLISVQGHPEYNQGMMECIVETRHGNGIFDNGLYKDGMSRAGNSQDGLLIARTVAKFVLDAEIRFSNFTKMSNQIRTINPATHEVIFEQAGTSLEEAIKVAATSKKAFESYRTTSLEERKTIVKRVLDIVEKNRDELANELTLQMGRPIRYCAGEINTMRLRAEYLMDIADESLSDLPGRAEAGFRRSVKRVPLGPVLIAGAWNYPYLTTVNALVPALLAGNSVILRPSPQTPLFGNKMLQFFTEAGLPSDVLQIVHIGSLDVLDQVAQIPEIQSVSFTGSTAGGIRLREATARHIKPVNLELGGNDPAYVRPDVDVKHVAEQLVDGAVFNSGQSCCSIERVYVHEKVYDDFLRAVQEDYKLGDPKDQSTTTGPVISAQAVEKINSHVKDALAKGAVISTPSNSSFQVESNPQTQKGNFVAPIVLTNVNHTMATMKEETFGPVMPIMKVSSDDEAVALMNDSDFGLTASVWTKDISRGEELIDRIEAGTVFINRCDYPSPDLAWIGWKSSGLGCTLGPRGYDGFTKLKSYHIKHASS
ncbi:unnamed protein product [Penicillium olsonii]|nr:unnamed protein product [Penicillium olsonii]CAG7933266.1 unnamed protein product [Penicillium olsonii]